MIVLKYQPDSIKWAILFFLLAILGLQGCKTTIGITETSSFSQLESGIRYTITKKGDGDYPKVNDIVTVHYTLTLSDSTLIDSSYDRGEPVYFKLGAGQVIKGWDKAMHLFNKGTEAILVIPPDQGYGDKPMGAIPPNSDLIFAIKIVDIVPAPKPFDIDEDSPWEVTSSGLRYTIVEKGRGTRLEPGMRAKIHYSGFFEDMTIFDSSWDRNQPIEIAVGRGMVIKGWEEGLLHLRVGDKARFFIPYDLAYGEHGRGPIPPAANLIFDIEVMDVKSVQNAIPFDVQRLDTLETDSGLQYLMVERGRGQKPTPGQTITVHYSGYLPSGELFDSSVERDEPFQFVLGQGHVISGWDEGIALMQKNSRYRFVIPPELGYGNSTNEKIPPGSTLIFDIELIDFK